MIIFCCYATESRLAANNFSDHRLIHIDILTPSKEMNFSVNELVYTRLTDHAVHGFGKKGRYFFNG